MTFSKLTGFIVRALSLFLVLFPTPVAYASMPAAATEPPVSIVAVSADVAFIPDPIADYFPLLGEQNLFISNKGPDATQNVVLSFPVPDGAKFDHIDSSRHTMCTLPPRGGTGEIICSFESLGVNEMINVNVFLNYTAPSGTKLPIRATVSSDAPDVNPDNNLFSRDVTVAGVPRIDAVRVLSKPFQIEITGQNFQPLTFIGTSFGVGCDCAPLPVTFLSSYSPERVVFAGGNALKAMFPKGVPTQICYNDQLRRNKIYVQVIR